MNRRVFLASAGATAALAACPLWIRRAFASACNGDPIGSGTRALLRSYRAAAEMGKPLLVLVIPADANEVWDRGATFGALLNHASPAQLAPLALVEVACATMSDVRKLAPAPSGEPLCVLVETDQTPPRMYALDAALPSRTVPEGISLRWTEVLAREDEVVDRQIAVLGALLHDAIAPDARTIAARARLAIARLGDAERARIEQALAARAELPLADVDRAAALVAAGMERASTNERARRETMLASAAAARLRDRPPRGSRWAHSSGCGTTIEGEEDESIAIGCGMGHVPRKSQRFLYLYPRTRTPVP
jgi:hypothetical protein